MRKKADVDVEKLAGYEWDNDDSDWRRQKTDEYDVAMSGKIPATKIVADKSDAQRVLATLEQAKVTAVDTEFNEEGKISLWSLSTGGNRIAIMGDCLRYFKRWLESDAPKIFHHAYADIPVFEYNGIKLGGFAADTLVMDWLVDENRYNHGLKECAWEWLAIPMTSYGDAFAVIPPGKKAPVLPDQQTILEESPQRFADYASLDPYATYWLYRHHKKILVALKLWDYYTQHERPFTETLIAMASRGVCIDRNILLEIGHELNLTMSRLLCVFRQIAPTIGVIRKHAGKEFVESIEASDVNLDSPPQMAALFYDTLKCKPVDTRRPRSTDRENLEVWADKGNVLAKLVLDFRGASKYKGTFIGSEDSGKGLIPKLLQDAHGQWIVHTDLYQAGTVSGRISSRDPNLQNIPARKEKDPYRIRRAFRARKGCKLVVADYHLAEICMMAHYSQDANLIRILREGRDVHSVTALKILAVQGIKCKEEDVKEKYPDARNKAKAINFGIQYGLRAYLLSSQLGVSEDEAQKYIDGYFEQFPGIYRFMRRTVSQTEDNGYVTTLLGRQRRIPEILSSDKGIRKHAQNAAMNLPIQGGVADVIKVAMNAIERDQFLKDHECKLLLQVHDELILEAPEIDAYVCSARVKELMEADFFKLTVPLTVDANVADCWEEGK